MAARNGDASLPVTIALLVGVLAFGLDCTFGQLTRNGFYGDVHALLSSDRQSVPDSVPGSVPHPLLRRYTGIAPVDNLFVCLHLGLSGLSIASQPATLLCLLSAAGQFAAAHIVLVIEGLRTRNVGNVLFYSAVWGLLIMVFAYANVMPVFCILHLLLTRDADASCSDARLRDPSQLVAVVPALLPAYLVFATWVVSCFRDVVASQWLLPLVCLLPLQVALCQRLARGALRRVSVYQFAPGDGPRVDGLALQQVYDVAWTLAAVTQGLAYAVLAAAKLLPPSVLDGRLARQLTFANAFVPGSPHSGKPYTSGTGSSAMHSILIYDTVVGWAAALIWALALLRRACPSSFSSQGLPATLLGLVREMLISGPAGAFVWLLMHRDGDLLVEEQAQADAKHTCGKLRSGA